MNAIQKAAFAASALAITLVGAALVTAPMAFAHPVPIVAHSDCSASSGQLVPAGQVRCGNFSYQSRLVALNRR
ncbi:MAG TPA: hypothetical protein VIC29_16030 [Steroidobacteraceae bacterium]|jgi:hypothetical protein